jgi:hypothetical protein
VKDKINEDGWADKQDITFGCCLDGQASTIAKASDYSCFFIFRLP